jgi:hypothetical protein
LKSAKKHLDPTQPNKETYILIPGDCDDSVDPGEPVAYEPEEQSMTSELNESLQELVARLSKLEEKFQAFEQMDKKLTLIGGSVDTLNSSLSNLTSSGAKSETATTEGSTINHTLAEDILKSTLQQIDSMTLHQGQPQSQPSDEVKSAVKGELTDAILPKLAAINKLVEALSLVDRNKVEKMDGKVIAEVVQSQLTQVIMPKLAELGKAVAIIFKWTRKRIRKPHQPSVKARLLISSVIGCWRVLTHRSKLQWLQPCRMLPHLSSECKLKLIPVPHWI